MKRIIYVIIIALCLFFTMGLVGGDIDTSCPTDTPVSITDVPDTSTPIPDTETPIPSATKEFTRTPQPTNTKEIPTGTNIPTSSPVPTTAISTAVVTSTLSTVPAVTSTATRTTKNAKPTPTPDCNEEENVKNGLCIPDTGFWDSGYANLLIVDFAILLGLICLVIIVRLVRKH